MIACPDKEALIHAYVDDELDAASSIELEAHLRDCTECAKTLSTIEALRTLLVSERPRHAAPARLKAEIESRIDEAELPPTTRWYPWIRPVARLGHSRSSYKARKSSTAFGRGLGSGLAAGLALGTMMVVALPQLARPGVEDVYIDSHIRSLSVGNHLTDVATSNRHVVKPWFNGKIDFAPPVPELTAQGFPLVGGRLDYLGGQQVAAIVYKRRLHTINLFVKPADRLSFLTGSAMRHDGYSLVRWTQGGLEFWAVSDVDLSDLQTFRRAYETNPSL